MWAHLRRCLHIGARPTPTHSTPFKTAEGRPRGLGGCQGGRNMKVRHLNIRSCQLDQWSDHRPLCDGWVKPSLGHNAGDLLTNHVEGLSDQICLPVRKQSIAVWFLEDPNICSKSPHQIHVMGEGLLLWIGKQSNDQVQLFQSFKLLFLICSSP